MSIKYVNVLIIIEHIAREFDSACMLKYQYETLGYTAEIVGIYPNKEMIPLHYKADIILIPWAYSDKDMQYFKCFLRNSPDAIFINLHHEQYSGQDDKNICLPKGESRLMYHISWGKKFTDSLIACGCVKESILEVGNIKLDIYKKNMRSLFWSKDSLSKRHNIDATKRWVLFIANSFHLMADRKLESIAEKDPDIYEKASIGIKCRKDFLSFVHKYLSTENDVVFIYRPHPYFAMLDIQSDDIKKLLLEHKHNFFAISDYAIGNWIVNADLCLSFHSTSAAECCVSGVPYYLFRTQTLPENQDYSFFVGYPYVIISYADFCSAVRTSRYSNDELMVRLKDYYSINDEMTYVKIALKSLACDNLYKLNVSITDLMKNTIRAYLKAAIFNLSKIKLFYKVFEKYGDDRWLRIINNSDTFTNNAVNKFIKRLKNINHPTAMN